MLSRLSPSYWLVQLPDRLDGDARLIESERRELATLVSDGLPRTELRATFNLLTWIYAGLSVATGVLAAFCLGAAPMGLQVASLALAYLTLSEALYNALRWLSTPADDAIAVWRPLVADLLIVALALVLAVTTLS